MLTLAWQFARPLGKPGPDGAGSAGSCHAFAVAAVGGRLSGAVRGRASWRGCSGTDRPKETRIERRRSVPASPRVVAPASPSPRAAASTRSGSPTRSTASGTPRAISRATTAPGIASYYADDFHGRRTSNGEIFDMWALSAAHPTLPLPSYVYVTNLENGRTLLLRVNDRGPLRQQPDDRRVARGGPLSGLREARHGAGARALRRPRAAHRRRPPRAALPGEPAVVPGGAVASARHYR